LDAQRLESQGDFLTSTHTRNLGKYRLIARLGQGGMAEVFLTVVAGPAGFNKLLVIKLMKPELLEEPEHKAMFLDEGKVAARLMHPNIVQTHEVQIEGDQYFMAMEYLDGQPLHRILRRAHKTETYLPLHWHLSFLCDVLSALEYAHNLTDYDGTPLRLVHRDVTPHNVFVTYAGQVKLCDFGIAKSMVSSVETRAGILRGKVAYMAPEQVLGAGIDHRADLFSVGVMLWEGVTHARMWDGHAEIQIMQALSQGRIPRARDAAADVDPELEQILDRALAARPEQRYQNAREFRSAIESFLFTHTARVDQRAVGEWVAKLFEKERSNLQAVIQDQLTGRHQAPPGLDSLAPPGADSAPSRSSRGVAAMSETSGQNAASIGQHQKSGSTIASVEVRALKPRRSIAAAMGVAGALAVFMLVVLVALVVKLVGSKSSQAQTPDVEGLPSTATAEGARAAAPPSTSPEEKRVQLRVRVSPPDARVTLDGRRLSEGPYSGQHVQDDQVHELEIQADGYASETRKVHLDANQDIEVVLSKATTAQKGGKGFVKPAKPSQPDTPDIKNPKKPPSTQLDPDDPWK
jgi:serine/threonine protein kinase